jgi:outer membrane protein OmpA-like peptidoglycan-associated protein
MRVALCLASVCRFGLVAVGAVVFSASCRSASATAPCSYENWQGLCQLKEINRVRLVESMPAIAVVEAVYEPQATGDGPTLLPPTRRQEFSVRAEQETDLRAHLQSYPVLQCRFQERTGGSCAEGRTEVVVPEYQPPPPPDVSADAGPAESGGCAELDRGEASAQGAAAELPPGVPTELLFPADSSEKSPEIEQGAARIAEALQSNPDIQCLAVIGHVTAGERMILGDERAALVKNLLVARGVVSNRLQTIAAVVPMTGGAPRAVIAEDRKVRLRVLRRSQ